MPTFYVHRLERPAAQYSDKYRKTKKKKRARGASDDDNSNRHILKWQGVGGDATVGWLKRRVADEWGVPPERQRYHGVWMETRTKYRFNTTDEIFHGNCYDGTPLLTTCSRSIRYANVVAVVFLPEGGGTSEDADKVRVVRRVSAAEAVARRIEAGRADAVEVADDSDDDDDEAAARPSKRARRVVKREEESTEGMAASQGGGEGDQTACLGTSSVARSNTKPGAVEVNSNSDNDKVSHPSKKKRPAMKREDESAEGMKADNGGGGWEQSACPDDAFTGDRAECSSSTATSRAAPSKGAASGAKHGTIDGSRGDAEEKDSGDAGGSKCSSAGDLIGERSKEEAEQHNAINAVADPAGGGAIADGSEGGHDVNEDEKEVEQTERGEEREDNATAATAPAAGLSALRQWLRRIDEEEDHGDLLESLYGAAFERHFVSLASLKRAARSERVGVDRILKECGVEALGDVALLDEAIGKL